MLIRRYLLKQIAQTCLAIMLVVLLIAVSNKFIRFMAKAAIGEIAPNLLWEILLFQVPDLIAFLLPVALFLGILMSLSKLYADNEMQVLFACGFSWKPLLLMILGLASVVMLLSGSISCYWGPEFAKEREKLLRQEGPLFLLQTVSPERFQSIDKDRLVFYVNELNNDRSHLGRLFIAEYPKGGEWSVLTAETGDITTDPETGLSYITLKDGQRYNGLPGKNDYNVVSFKSSSQLLENPVANEGVLYHRTMPTIRLWQHPDPGNLAELQWRLAIPLSALLLALLAVPLSQVSPRQGRYGHLFIAVMICVFYFNLLTMSKRWVAKGQLSPMIGLWWVQILLLIIAFVLIAKASGRLNPFLARFKKRLSYAKT